jgi:hypothetical protein
MRLTTANDPIPIFPIRLQYLSGSVYVANVTAHTTGEVLLENFQACVGSSESYKLTYYDEDIKFTDTLGKLGIEVYFFSIIAEGLFIYLFIFLRNRYTVHCVLIHIFFLNFIRKEI